MKNDNHILKEVAKMESLAHQLLHTAATVKQGLSGGSESPTENKRSLLSVEHKNQLITRRRKTAYGKLRH